MKQRNVGQLLKTASLAGLAVASALLLQACAPKLEVPATVEVTCSTTPVMLDLTSSTLPVPPQFSGDSTNVDCAWDQFSWNTFAALNWPVNSDRRGVPDVSGGANSTFLTAPSDATLVWETFKEKREIFVPAGTGTPSTEWNDEPSYPIPDNIVSNAYEGFCTAEDQTAAGEFSEMRQFLNIDKFNTLDETAEVASEAREGYIALCGGYLADPATTCASDPTAHPCCQVDPNPDPANADNSNRPNGSGLPVGPRVWNGQAATSDQPIYYEVKVNYDFFDYVIDNEYYNENVAERAAILGQISLPFRTTAAINGSGDFAGQNSQATRNYTTAGCASNYSSTTETNPCTLGAMHLKAAWIPLAAPSTDYHTTEAIYYQSTGTDDEEVCMKVDTFGLLALHIIQRIHISTENGTNQPKHPPDGGSFIFSSWEHKSVDTGFTYVNYPATYTQGVLSVPDNMPFPALDHALTVSRQATNPILEQTQSVNTSVDALTAGTVWNNYRLAGTQFAAMTETGSESVAQAHFLANLVVETNIDLQDFEGVPLYQPRTQPPQYTTRPKAGAAVNSATRKVAVNETDGYVRDTDNITFGGGALNMGGCMGCHGVAQQNGYSFSFVLLGNQQGADVDTEDQIDIPPPGRPSTDALTIKSCTDLSASMVANSAGLNNQVTLAADTSSSAQQWTLNKPFTAPTASPRPGFYALTDGSDGGFLTIDTTSKQVVSMGSNIGSPNSDNQLWQLVPVVQNSTEMTDPVDGTSYFQKDYSFVLQSADSELVLTVVDGKLVAQAAGTIGGSGNSPDYSSVTHQMWVFSTPDDTTAPVCYPTS